MHRLQIRSARGLLTDPELGALAVAALIRADAMGLLSRQITSLDEESLQNIETGMAEVGIDSVFMKEYRHLSRRESEGRPSCSQQQQLVDLLRRVVKVLDDSPVPAHEWPVLQKTLGPELLGRLLGVSETEAGSYDFDARLVPDEIAARLHFLAFVATDLAGSYSDEGIRRWFDRKRERLDGSSPAELLCKSWSPEDDKAREVRELAEALHWSPTV